MKVQHEVDYLVVGAGATAMAFVDTMLQETGFTFAIVDRYEKPGGHWRVAYDHVRLHQPSDGYGVNSRPLGESRVDESGYNAGLLELATGAEIREYFERVMEEHFLPSGRVQYFARTEYLGGTSVRLPSDETTEFIVRRAVVDSAFMNVKVPAVTPAPFDVEAGARVSPPNALRDLDARPSRYVVVGGGKTGVDAVLHLLAHGTAPEAITWVVPRDAWLINRRAAQPGERFREISDGFQAARNQAWATSSSMDEFYDAMNRAGYFLRLSDDVRPTAFRCATVTENELAAIRSVTDVVRLGRLVRAAPATAHFERGTISFEGDDVLYVDCTANGLARIETVPVFGDRRITLQPVLYCQQVYSAAFIGYVESRFDDLREKNELTVPVPHPNADSDLFRAWAVNLRSEIRWSLDPELVQWRQDARLAGFQTRTGTRLPSAGPERERVLEQRRAAWQSIIDQAEGFLADLEGASVDDAHLEAAARAR